MASAVRRVVVRQRSIFAITALLFAVTAQAQHPVQNSPDDVAAEMAQASFDKLFAEGRYDEAAESAKRLIAILLKDAGYDRLQYAQLLSRLGEAQHNAGAYEAATQNYLYAIRIIEDAGNRLDNKLVVPLLGLSRNYVAAGRYVDGLESYKRTLHVHQVNTGLFDEDKAHILAELSEAYFGIGKLAEANAIQESIVNMIGRNHPGNDLARLPSLYSQADMFSRTGRNERSLVAYHRIIALIEKSDGPKSLALLDAFYSVSQLLATNHIMDGEQGVYKARRFMRRAVNIAEKSDQADSQQKADTYIRMGDFLCVYTPSSNSMIRSYKQGWTELSHDEEHHPQRDDLFAEPVLLNPVPVGTPPAMVSLLENADDTSSVKNGVVIVRYDVGENGRSENVRIVESVPEDYHDYIVKNYVRSFAFRPRFVDGSPVVTSDQTFEIRFSYQNEDLSEKVRQNAIELAASEAAQ